MGILTGKKIVITGSSRGLGRAFAIACAEQGAKIVINGTNSEALNNVQSQIRANGGLAESLVGSIAEEEVCIELIAKCVKSFGGIDILVNNAGIVRDRTIMKMTVEEWDEVIAINLRGAFCCTKYAALAMKENASGGHIIQIISASGLSGGFGQGNYAASKAGMMGLLRTSLLELERHNIRSNAMWPVAQTDMTKVVFDRAEHQAKQAKMEAPTPEEMGFGKPEEVAAGLVWLASDKAKHLNGQCLSFNGRKTALWSHPEEHHVSFKNEAWSIEDLDSYYRDKSQFTVYNPRIT